jgi:hypothetical protein
VLDTCFKVQYTISVYPDTLTSHCRAPNNIRLVEVRLSMLQLWIQSSEFPYISSARYLSSTVQLYIILSGYSLSLASPLQFSCTLSFLAIRWPLLYSSAVHYPFWLLPVASAQAVSSTSNSCFQGERIFSSKFQTFLRNMN